MAIHPEIAEKMRAEVLDHCGPHAFPTIDQIHQLRYSKPFFLTPKTRLAYPQNIIVRAVINETLRLFPPVPLNVRESRDAPCLLPPSDHSYPFSERQSQSRESPLFMPANTTVTWLPLLTQRNKALWGEDADEFRPERWLNPETQAKCNTHMGMFLPFSHGPRIVSVFFSSL